MQTVDTLTNIINNITISYLLYDDARWRLLPKGDGFLLQLVYKEPDSNDPDGPAMPQHCRKWYISQHSTETEVVRTAYKAVRASLEHRLGEHFHYKGRPIYSPHTSVEGMLLAIAEVPLDSRE